MKVETFLTTPDDPAGLHTAYHQMFEPLRDRAAFRQVLDPDELDTILADPRWTTYLAYTDDGGLAGMGTLTQDFDAMQMTAPIERAFYRRRFPDAVNRGAFWYVGFIGVIPDQQGSEAFKLLLHRMSAPAADARGVVGVDYCRFNRDDRHLHDASAMILLRHYGVPVDIRDPAIIPERRDPLCAQYADAYDFRNVGPALP